MTGLGPVLGYATVLLWDDDAPYRSSAASVMAISQRFVPTALWHKLPMQQQCTIVCSTETTCVPDEGAVAPSVL